MRQREKQAPQSAEETVRDIALKDQRQVFFATANEKIAKLFERKFDFLGNKFRKIQLSREA